MKCFFIYRRSSFAYHVSQWKYYYRGENSKSRINVRLKLGAEESNLFIVIASYICMHQRTAEFSPDVTVTIEMRAGLLTQIKGFTKSSLWKIKGWEDLLFDTGLSPDMLSRVCFRSSVSHSVILTRLLWLSTVKCCWKLCDKNKTYKQIHIIFSRPLFGKKCSLFFQVQLICTISES